MYSSYVTDNVFSRPDAQRNIVRYVKILLSKFYYYSFRYKKSKGSVCISYRITTYGVTVTVDDFHAVLRGN